MVLRLRYGYVLSFERPDADGRLTEIRDRNGNRIRLEYAPRSITVTDSLDRRTVLRLDAGRLMQVRDPANRRWHFAYDNYSRLMREKCKWGQPLKREVSEKRTKRAYTERQVRGRAARGQQADCADRRP